LKLNQRLPEEILLAKQLKLPVGFHYAPQGILNTPKTQKLNSLHICGCPDLIWQSISPEEHPPKYTDSLYTQTRSSTSKLCLTLK
jgi:hypothetical protein